jgi:hypothetical protein
MNLLVSYRNDTDTSPVVGFVVSFARCAVRVSPHEEEAGAAF